MTDKTRNREVQRNGGEASLSVLLATWRNCTGEHREPLESVPIWEAGLSRKQILPAMPSNSVMEIDPEAAVDNSDEALPAFDMLFGLLGDLDDGEDIVFFADEGGSYLLNPGWEAVLPAYFTCLAKTSSPEEYSSRVSETLRFGGLHDKKLLRAAHEAATSEQRLALPASVD